ncbi:MAG: ATP-grasp domain-containing protein [Bacteroidota bacterium]
MNAIFHWVFPDSTKGIEAALTRGADTFWLNTVLYENHPIEAFFNEGIRIIGQAPSQVDLHDDKIVTNRMLADHGISIPAHFIIEKLNELESVNTKLPFPMVVKPVRGRGSQGVSIVKDGEELLSKVKLLLDSGNYGRSVYVEQFLSGKEITITVMPPGRYLIHQKEQIFQNPWSLPPVERFNHIDGIAPYNGTVAVVDNSRVLLESGAHIQQIKQECEKAAALVNAKAPIRIDCRADEQGVYHLFDLNMKPNMTGASRVHRSDQDSLTMIAAREIGWTYFDLLSNMIQQRWKTA